MYEMNRRLRFGVLISRNRQIVIFLKILFSEHDDKWKFKCGFCEEVFEEKRDLKNHTFIHPESGNSLPLPKPPVKKKPVKKRPYHELPKKICVECGWSGINLSTHMKREHHNEIYRYLSRCIKLS
jgi:hypothetical protein